MSFFAVQYVYDASATDIMNEVRPEHRQYLGELVAQGVVLASGPWVNSTVPGALLLFKAENMENIKELLAGDPFAKAGVITSTQIEQWDPVLGVFS